MLGLRSMRGDRVVLRGKKHVAPVMSIGEQRLVQLRCPKASRGIYIHVTANSQSKSSSYTDALTDDSKISNFKLILRLTKTLWNSSCQLTCPSHCCDNLLYRQAAAMRLRIRNIPSSTVLVSLLAFIGIVPLNFVFPPLKYVKLFDGSSLYFATESTATPEFQCPLEPCHISMAFMGDSLSRFMYYSVAYYLRHGQWIVDRPTRNTQPRQTGRFF